jgi:hypothetical protein
MFRRNRLPTDNFPDDFDTRVFRYYHPTMRPGVGFLLRGVVPRAALWGSMLAVIAGGFLTALLIVPESGPRVVVVTPVPSPTLAGDVTGDFPATVSQVSMSLPARIDEALALGEQHGYRFLAGPGLTWEINVLTDGGFMPRIILYNPDGTVAQVSEGQNLTFSASEPAQYGLLIEAGNGGAGGYTLRIFPT